MKQQEPLPEGREVIGAGFETTAVRVSGVSIGVNLFLSLFKLLAGIIAHSGAMVSDAVHSASDVFSSIIVIIGVKLAGIAGARMGYPIADTAASLLICVFIAKASYDIFKDAVGKMVDRSCSRETEQAIHDCAAAIPGVIKVDLLHTRVFGSRIYVDIEIRADGKLTLEEGHEIARQVHVAVEDRFPDVKHIMVHVNPYSEEMETGK